MRGCIAVIVVLAHNWLTQALTGAGQDAMRPGVVVRFILSIGSSNESLSVTNRSKSLPQRGFVPALAGFFAFLHI